jgi:5'-nucleotidase
MAMLTMIVDMDEVLANFVDPVLFKWNAVYGTAHTRTGFNMWDMSKTLGPGAYQLVESWISEPGFFRHLKPLDGAIEGLNHFIQDKSRYDVIIATSLSSTVNNGYDDKRAWLHQWFPQLLPRNFFALSRKEMLRGDILIDDAVHNVMDWIKTKRPAIIMDRPWNHNEHFMGYHSVFRADGWPYIINLLEGQYDRIRYHD